jgi:uncharacterized protein
MSDDVAAQAVEQEIGRMVRLLVDHPEDVDVETLVAGRQRILKVRVRDREVGQVVGKQGATVTGLRSVLAALSGKHRVEYQIEVEGRNGGAR